MVQGELFREEQTFPTANSESRSFLSQYRLTVTFDKLLIALIALLVAFVLTYSFGVERGKRVMEKHLEALVPVYGESLQTEKKTDSSNSSEEVISQNSLDTPKEMVLVVHQNVPAESAGARGTQVSVQEKPETLLPAPDPVRKDDFTVQLITYVSESMAAKEINRLKSKGHESFAIPSGRYFQVCVNYFKNKSQAKSFLRDLRSEGRYPDAYIRPVVR
jgi:cell division septation protein DedD